MIRVSASRLNQGNLGQYVRFALVGAASAIVYFVAANGLHLAGAPLWVSSGLARVLAMVIAFAGHMRVTFRVAGSPVVRAVRFVISRGLLVGVAIAITYLVVDLLEQPYSVGAIGVIVLMPLFSFPLLKYWVFRDRSA